MKMYFLSCMPCELTVNGIFFGIVDSFERFAEVNLADNLFARFTPQGALPVGLFLNDELLLAPPKFCEVYLLKDAVALYIKHFSPLDCALAPLAQVRQGETLVTLFRQGELHLSIQSPKGFFVSTLPPAFENSELLFHGELCFVNAKNFLAIYTKGGERVFLEQIREFSVEGNALNATLPLSDSLNRVAECKYALHENGLTRTQFVLRQTPAIPRDGLVAYAFFESILIGADYAQFLADELKPQAEKLVEFLGKFESVTVTESPYTCGLVKRKSENLFSLSYATVCLDMGKITDVRC